MMQIGKLMVTASIQHDIDNNAQFREEVQDALKKYLEEDFSDMECEEDIVRNREAIKSGNEGIFASYNTSLGKIYIITEQDRSVTTIIYPDEY